MLDPERVPHRAARPAARAEAEPATDGPIPPGRRHAAATHGPSDLAPRREGAGRRRAPSASAVMMEQVRDRARNLGQAAGERVGYAVVRPRASRGRGWSWGSDWPR